MKVGTRAEQHHCGFLVIYPLITRFYVRITVKAQKSINPLKAV